jgi:pimeloyl-ACP methyl ester carboxylesterase
MPGPTPTPFEIHVPDSLLGFIHDRVRTARLPPPIAHPDGKASTYGVSHETMTALQDHWNNRYNWRAVEARLNSSLKQFTVPILHEGEDLNIHFVHHRSPQPDAIPLIFVHGWPGSFLEVERILTPLTHPPTEKAQAFHVVAPSLPGIGFSSAPKTKNFGPEKIAGVFHKLMMILGYDHYVSQGGDWGSLICRYLAADHPKACLGVHLNFVIALPPLALKNPLELFYLATRWMTPYQKEMIDRMIWWKKEEGGYAEIMSTKPMTIAFALVDSPLGFAAWIRDKIDSLVDEYEWTEEEVITLCMMYILPGNSAFANLYKEGIADVKANILKRVIPSEVCFGASFFPKDVGYCTPGWAKCRVAANIVFWREHTKGGHFASLETPDVLVEDIRDFSDKIGGESWKKLIHAGSEKN